LARFYSDADGRRLLKAARTAIRLCVIYSNFDRREVANSIKDFDAGHGIFVTIKHSGTGELRGCVGFPQGSRKLCEALVDAAVAAALEDDRFIPVSEEELGHISIEVSILTEPKRIKVTTIASARRNIVIGRHGLMVEYGFKRGLLLPSVPVEEQIGLVGYLEAVCIKAGMGGDAWKRGDVKLYTFETQTFEEHDPLTEYIAESP
jgi:uncharacterized protein (TIGR00296 family)